MAGKHPAINNQLRRHQEADAELGGLFKALHTFADRTVERFFDDTTLPHPVVALEKVRTTCKGEYMPKDGMALVHRITIDPFKVKDGAEAAEVLAHEIVHMWQAATGTLPERNYHNAEFHNRLGNMGILSGGKAGHHNGYAEGDVWQLWLEENDDLMLRSFLLPGEDDSGRRLYKFQCPECEFSFRTRRQEVYVVCMNDECAVPMEFIDE